VANSAALSTRHARYIGDEGGVPIAEIEADDTRRKRAGAEGERCDLD